MEFRPPTEDVRPEFILPPPVELRPAIDDRLLVPVLFDPMPVLPEDGDVRDAGRDIELEGRPACVRGAGAECEA
ncbi:MAG TPA: hypothetical protein VFO39_20120 [Candidatus Sulfotelmatobacter sp.]|nr:hypothetical protein [Candidatus Sulfotelmatobacter sp.]